MDLSWSDPRFSERMAEVFNVMAGIVPKGSWDGNRIDPRFPEKRTHPLEQVDSMIAITMLSDNVLPSRILR